MTRKDYVPFAAELRMIDAKINDQRSRETFRETLDVICGALKRENANFDRAKFIAAATIEA